MSEIEFRISTAQLGRSTSYIVAASGELDLHAAPEFDVALHTALKRGGTRIVVDLLQTSLIDSTALGILTGVYRELRARGGELVMVTNDPAVLRPFRVTGLDRLFQFRSTLLEAVDAELSSSHVPQPA